MPACQEHHFYRLISWRRTQQQSHGGTVNPDSDTVRILTQVAFGHKVQHWPSLNLSHSAKQDHRFRAKTEDTDMFLWQWLFFFGDGSKVCSQPSPLCPPQSVSFVAFSAFHLDPISQLSPVYWVPCVTPLSVVHLYVFTALFAPRIGQVCFVLIACWFLLSVMCFSDLGFWISFGDSMPLFRLLSLLFLCLLCLHVSHHFAQKMKFSSCQSYQCRYLTFITRRPNVFPFE